MVDAEGNEVGKVTSRRLLAEPRGADRHGLCAARFRRAGHAASRSPSRGKIFTGIVTPMPFVPHRYHRKGAAQ